MPNQSMQQAAHMLETIPLGPEVRKERRRELDKVRHQEAKRFQEQLNDRLAKAKDGYKAVNEAQGELEDEFEALADREGRLPATEYQRRLEELSARQRTLDRDRDRHRSELVGVGEAIDELEDNPDAVIDDFYGKYEALRKPTRDLSW